MKKWFSRHTGWGRKTAPKPGWCLVVALAFLMAPPLVANDTEEIAKALSEQIHTGLWPENRRFSEDRPAYMLLGQASRFPGTVVGFDDGTMPIDEIPIIGVGDNNRMIDQCDTCYKLVMDDPETFKTPTEAQLKDILICLEGMLPDHVAGEKLEEGSTAKSILANHNTQIPVETQFRVGPLSELVVSVAVMQMVEAGKIKLDVDINKQGILPFELPLATRLGRKRSDITPRMLLDRTVCIQDDWDVLKHAVDLPETSLARSIKTYFSKSFRVAGSCFPSGTWSHSVMSTALAAYLVECVAGQDFDLYCNENIFQPLGMDSTRWRYYLHPNKPLVQPLDYGFVEKPKGTFKPLNHMAWFREVYNLHDMPPMPSYNPPFYPAGSLWTTAPDLMRLLRTLSHRGQIEGGGRILAEDTFRQMESEIKTMYYMENTFSCPLPYGFLMYRWDKANNLAPCLDPEELVGMFKIMEKNKDLLRGLADRDPNSLMQVAKDMAGYMSGAPNDDIDIMLTMLSELRGHFIGHDSSEHSDYYYGTSGSTNGLNLMAAFNPERGTSFLAITSARNITDPAPCFEMDLMRYWDDLILWKGKGKPPRPAKNNCHFRNRLFASMTDLQADVLTYYLITVRRSEYYKKNSQYIEILKK